MELTSDAIARGHYAQKQLGCQLGVIAWSHRSRFCMAAKLVGSEPSENLLDYGCGDGTFLAMISDRFASCVGADINLSQVKDCQARFRGLSNVHFVSTEELKEPSHSGQYRVVTCMETLEHCTARVVENVLEDLNRLSHPQGKVIISVPIEIGPTFLAKYGLRSLAAWRNIGQYRSYERYSLQNAVKMVFAGPQTVLKRPVYGPEDAPYHSHYGFNWRHLRTIIEQHLRIEQIRFSPLDWFKGVVSSQVWFLCRPKSPPGERST